MGITILNNPNIAIFFRDPRSIPQPPDNFSQLYLLRRDIDSCFGINPNNGCSDSWPAVQWPGVMTILAGIDLLGKFLAGQDAPRKVGERFRRFLMQYFELSAEDAEIMYQLRNSLLHSFGLYSYISRGIVYQFTLSCNLPQLITSTSDNNFSVNIELLRTEFEVAVNAYHDDLLAADDSDQFMFNFSAMFSRHRLVGIS